MLVWRQKKNGFQTCCGEDVEQTVDDVWQIIDDDDWELRTQTHSSQWDVLKPGAEDNDGPSQRAYIVHYVLVCVCVYSVQ